MVVTELDPRLTFDNFVVGPANRLAAAASRRAADSPGTSYNPLFIYSASGLGKSHILNAIAHHANRAHPDFKVLYQTLERYLEELTAALESGDREVLRERYQDLDLLLLDDVQFLTGQSEAQEMLLRTLDSLNMGESQIVLASDRPPADIDGLDARLLSRFAGGLIVDIGPPEYETRVAIIRKKAEERSAEMTSGVAETIARVPFKNVRELGGALNRVFAVQELEERQVTADDVKEILGLDGKKPTEKRSESDDGGAFMSEITGDVAATVEEREAPWRKVLRTVAEAAEAEGFTAGRIRRLIEADEPPDDPEAIADEFRRKMTRLNEVKVELDRVGNPWPEAAFGVLKDPERLDEAESLLASARERVRPFPSLKPGPDVDDLEQALSGLAIKATRQIATGETPEYTPLYLWSPEGTAARALAGAGGRTFREAFPEQTLAVISVTEFAEEFIHSLSSGVAGAWRERWWSVDLLLLYGLQALSDTERAQDEFFHLFEALKRRKARVVLVADRPPSEVEGVDDRLLSRFEGGLVLEVESGVLPDGADDLSPGAGAEDESATGRGEVVIPPLDQIVGQGEERGGLFAGAGESAGTEREGAPGLADAEAALGLTDEKVEPAEATGDAEAPPPAAEEEPPTPEAEEPPTPEAEEPPTPEIEEPATPEVEESATPDVEEPPTAAEVPTPEAAGEGEDVTAEEGEGREEEAPAEDAEAAPPAWDPSPENVIVEWPEMEDRVVEELE